jgi:hypothetical protein
MKASDRFASGAGRATCECCQTTYEVLNLSVGGFFLACAAPLPVGTKLSLTLSLESLPPFLVRVAVAWVNHPETPRAPDLPTGFGVRIVDVGLAAKLALIQRLRQIEGQERVR